MLGGVSSERGCCGYHQLEVSSPIGPPVGGCGVSRNSQDHRVRRAGLESTDLQALSLCCGLPVHNLQGVFAHVVPNAGRPGRVSVHSHPASHVPQRPGRGYPKLTQRYDPRVNHYGVAAWLAFSTLEKSEGVPAFDARRANPIQPTSVALEPVVPMYSVVPRHRGGVVQGLDPGLHIHGHIALNHLQSVGHVIFYPDPRQGHRFPVRQRDGDRHLLAHEHALLGDMPYVGDLLQGKPVPGQRDSDGDQSHHTESHHQGLTQQ